MSMKSSIGFELFQKLQICLFSNILNMFNKNTNLSREGAPALRVIRAGTRLTVYRALPLPLANCLALISLFFRRIISRSTSY